MKCTDFKCSYSVSLYKSTYVLPWTYQDSEHFHHQKMFPQAPSQEIPTSTPRDNNCSEYFQVISFNFSRALCILSYMVCIHLQKTSYSNFFEIHRYYSWCISKLFLFIAWIVFHYIHTHAHIYIYIPHFIHSFIHLWRHALLPCLICCK